MENLNIENENVKPETTTTEEVAPTTTVSNAEIKASPLFQKLATKLAEYEQRETARLAAEENARKDAEIKKAESEQRYQDALALREKELTETKQKYERTLLEKSIESELVEAGFKRNDCFFTGVKSKYDASKHGDTKAYIASLVANPENASFLTKNTSRQPVAPPMSVTATLGSDLTREQLDSMAKSENSEIRLKAIRYKADYFKKTGKLP